jgi:murein DD-endopeptidase MepM/ murein hydrolase activator NlpD
MGHEAIEALMELADTSAGREKASEIAQRAQQIGAEALAAVALPADAAAAVTGDAGGRTGSRRRTRRSAALMGLALSMGATDALALMQPLPAVAQSSGDTQSADLKLKPNAANPVASASDLALVPVSAPERGLLDSAQDLMTHVVQSGETLTRIASTYGVPVQNLIRLNRLPVSGAIVAGQELQVPAVAVAVQATLAEVPTQSVAAQPEAAAPTDALSRLRSQREQLKLSLNQFKPGEIGASDASSDAPIVATSQSAVELADLVPYRIQAGDTLDTIARAYEVSRSQIIAVNQLENPNVLKVDRVLGIPRSKATVKPESAKPMAQPVATQPVPVQPVAVQPVAVQPVLSRPVVAQPSITAPVKLAQAAPLALEVIPAPEPTATQPARIPPLLSSRAPLAPNADLALKTQPGGLSDALRPNSVSSYRVQLGDTLAQIARQHGLTMGELSNANGLNNPNMIYVGQLLTIPGVRGEAASGSPQSSDRARIALEAMPENNPTVMASPSPLVAVSAPAPVPTVNSLRVLSRQASSQPISIKVEPVAAQPAASPLVSGSIETRAAAPLRGLLSEVQNMRRPQPVNVDRTAEVPVPSKLGSIDLAVVPPAPAQPTYAARAAERQRVNPEFNASGNGSLNQPGRGPVQRQPELVASANLGSNNYEPLVKTLLGRAVSPELPMLTSDPFLPDGALRGLVWPAKGVLSSTYGWRWGRMHKGIDVAAPIGTPVVAVQSGVVTYARFNDGGYGNLVEITHPDGSITLYGHNDRLLVREGQRVSQGQQISEMGNTGFSTGPHLHFEYHPAGQGATDPMAFLPAR